MIIERVEEFIGDDPRDFSLSIYFEGHALPLIIGEVKWSFLKLGILACEGTSYWENRLNVMYRGKKIFAIHDKEVFSLYKDFCIKNNLGWGSDLESIRFPEVSRSSSPIF